MLQNILLGLRTAYFVLRIAPVVAVITALLPAVGAEFSRSRELPCLVISSSDLDDILRKAHSLIVTANGAAGERQYVREAIKAGVSGDEVEILGYSSSGSVSLPRAAYCFSYTYYRDGSSISSVRVELGDYSRRLSVTGEAQDQVEALTTLLLSNLLQHSRAIGGPLFRRMAGLLLFLALALVGVISTVHLCQTGRYMSAGGPIISALGLILLLVLPFDTFLPGFALYQGDSAFLVRYGPEISFFGVVATVAGIPLSYFLPQWLQKPHKSKRRK